MEGEPQASFKLQSLRYSRGSLQVLNQLKLPHQTEYVDIAGVEDAFKAIKTMMVRGAPLIAIVAALGLAVEACSGLGDEEDKEETASTLKEKLDYLKTSRPTAVNLGNACEVLKAVISEEAARPGGSGRSTAEAFVAKAEAMLEEDVAANRRQGEFAVEALLSEPSCKGKARLSVLTHCNTGSLATAGFGTALGVIRALSEKGLLEACFCTETRPYNQGARLTAYEFVAEGLPGTLIPDSAASFLMAQGKVDAVAVGADRVAANGDTANKIGTLQLAIAAAHYGIPFLVVAPLTSCDPETANGAEIVIEERPAEELKTVAGTKIAPDDIAAWNPAFDVTPAELITAVVTDEGVVPRKKAGDGKGFDVKAFCESNAAGETKSPATPEAPSPSLEAPNGYHALVGEGKIAEYLAGLPKVMALMGASSASDIESEEFGDGNLNLVFRCRGPGADARGTVIVKQALPYVRCVGESWPLTLDRAYYESEALMAAFKRCPDHSPEVYHADKTMATIVMRYIEPPHVILRLGLIKGLRYSTLAADMGTYLARTLFFSSALHLSGPEIKAEIGRWASNWPMCELTEKVVFSDPYMECDMNRWTSPELDDAAAELRTDVALRLTASRLKGKFMTSCEALIHADLHTGSVMAMEGSTQVIDPEFAFYGPMGFDLGALIGNLFLAYCAVPGNGQGGEYAEWLLEQVATVWSRFEEGFLELWSNEELHKGQAYLRGMYPDTSGLEKAQKGYMERLWQDTLGFAGMKMIRRVVGISHVEDLDGIEDRVTRAKCESHALALGKRLAMLSGNPGEKGDNSVVKVGDVCDLARSLSGA
eukprot:g4597.t1